jgi:hypothetical protein
MVGILGAATGESGGAFVINLLTIAQMCEALPSKPSARWLNDFLRKTKVDPLGQPLYRKAGRDKLIYPDRLIEALPCPSSSLRPATSKKVVRTTRSADRISASLLTRAAELTNDQSLLANSENWNAPSSRANTRRSKLKLVTGSEHS